MTHTGKADKCQIKITKAVEDAIKFFAKSLDCPACRRILARLKKNEKKIFRAVWG